MTGVECEGPDSRDIGFELSFFLRLRSFRDLNDYTEIFCSDMWETCPYAKALLETKYKNDA